MIRIGAMYLMMTVHTGARPNLLDWRTSSMIVFGLIIQPTKMQVRTATMGISTELETKSKKSSSCVPGPSGSMPMSTL